MTQTMTTQRKRCTRIWQVYLPLLSIFLLLSGSAFGQSKVDWQSGTPIQSSDLTVLGADGYLDLNFQVADANIPTAIFTVVLPPGVDYVTTTNQAGMTAGTTYTSAKTGTLAAGWILKYSITSNAKALRVNDIFSIRIGVKATCSVNITNPGQYSATVSGTGVSITDGAKNLLLSVRKPSVRLNPIGGGSRDYTTIGETQNFKLGLTSTNGTANSILVKLTYDGTVVTLSNFKIGSTTIPAANVTSTGTTTKVTTLKLTQAELGSPIDDIAKEISFDAVSSLGCDRTVLTQLQFDAVTNCETVNCETLVLKLPTETRTPSFTTTAHLQSARDWDATNLSGAAAWDQFCFDGTTPGYGHFIFRNNNNTEAASLSFQTWIYYGALNIFTYIDTTDVYYRIDGGPEVRIPGSSIKANAAYSLTAPSILAPLQGKVYNATITLPGGVHIPAGSTVEFRYAIYGNPEWRDWSNTQWFSTSNGLDVSYSAVVATNICGASWSSIGNFYTSTAGLPFFYYTPILQNVKPDATGVLSNYFTTGSYISAAGSNGTGRRFTEVFVKLPSWMSLDYTTNITEAFTIGTTVPVAGSGKSYGNNTYSVEYATNVGGNLNIKFKTGSCSGADDQKDTVRMWTNFNLGTPTTACKPKVEYTSQIFQPVVLNCSEKGMMLDSLYLYRQTRGLKDSDANHFPDDGTKALDSEINHSYYINGDTGYYYIKGHIAGSSGDSYEKLYTRLKLSPVASAVQLKFGTSGHVTPIWDQAVINVKKQGLDPAVTFPLSIPTVSSSDSIYALYDGVDNAYLLQPEDSVLIKIPFIVKGYATLNSLATDNVEVESYAMNTTPTNPFLPAPDERFGSDLLRKTQTAGSNYFGNYVNSVTYTFSSLTAVQSIPLVAISNRFDADFSKEVRYFVQPQSAKIRVPYGYYLTDGLLTVQTIKYVNHAYNTSVSLTPVSGYEDPATGDSIYTVDLTPLYDYTYDGSSPIASGKVFLGDDQQGVYITGKILPTPAVAPGTALTTTGNLSAIYYGKDATANAAAQNLRYTGPSLSMLMTPKSLMVNSEDMSVSSFKLINNGDITGKNVWIYVEGNARNASLVVSPGDTIFGQGLDGRWVKVGDMTAREQKDFKLNFIYTGGTSCNGDTIRIYSVVDFLDEGFIPDIAQSIASVGMKNRGLRQTLALNNSSSKTKIAGSVVANVSALTFNTAYTVALTIDGRGSQGALNDPKVNVTLPAGQEYKLNSATIEYPVGTIKPVSAEIEQLLKDAFSTVATLGDNNRSAIVSLAKALGRPSIMLPGWGADVDLGYDDGDRQAILNLTLLPKCETPLTGVHYKGEFTGKTACGQDVIDNGVVSITNPPVYTQIISGYNFKVTLANGNSPEKIFSPEKTTDVLSATFTKQLNANTIAVMSTDSIQLVLPRQLNLNGAIICSAFPGVVIGSNVVDGDVRTITLSLPASQLNTLMASSAAGTPFTYDIPVKYTADDQTLVSAPLQDIVAQVVSNLRFDVSCTPKLATIGSGDLNMLFVTFSKDPYLACLNMPTTLEVTSAGTDCKWYKESAKTTLLSSATIYDYTPMVQASSVFYLEAKYNNVVYGTVPITVNMNPAVSIVVTNPTAICDGSSIELNSSSIVAVTPSGSTLKFYSAATATLAEELTSTSVSPTSTSTTYYVQATTAAGCKSPIEPVTVTVNPIPSMTTLSNQTYNAGITTTAIALSGTNVTGFTWSGGSNVGLTDGNHASQIAAFTTTNSGATALTRTITVTPQYTSGSTCSGTAVTFTITVNPPVVAGTFPATSACLGTPCAAIVATGGTDVAYYKWTGGSSLGLADYSGTDKASIPAFTPTSSGTATITLTPYNSLNVAGGPTSFELTVNALPSMVSTTGTLNICLGKTTQLSNTTSGTGVWKSINPGVATVSSAGLVSGLAAGTSTIRYIVTNASGCQDSTDVTVTVNALPSMVSTTGTLSICIGKTTQLSNGTTGTGAWKSTDTGVATVSSTGLVSGITAGTTIIRYTVSNVSGCVDSTDVSVTINALPVMSTTTGTLSVCVNSTTQLSNSTTGTGTWKSTNPGAATVSSAGLVSGVASGTTTIRYIVTNVGGCVDSTDVTLTVYPLTAITSQPTIDPLIVLPNTYIIPGSNVELTTVAVGHNLTYQWYWKKSSDGTVVTLSDNSKYTGSTTANLTITNAYETENGDYYVSVSGTCNIVTSDPVTIVAVANQDASLKDLQVDGTTLSDFNPGKTDYIMAIACDEEQVTLLGIPNNAGATVTGNGTFTLQPGDNYFPIKVVAQDMVTTMTYTVNIVRNCYVPKIKKDLDDAVICLNGSHTWDIEAEGDNLTYEWYKGNKRIIGENSPSITFTDAKFSDYDRYYVIVRSNHNGFRSSIQSKKVRLWVADYLPEHLRLAEYPNPATVGKNYHLKVDGYVDVTKYSWSYSKSGVTFSPAVTLYNENETWATFGSLSVGTGTLKVTMEHPCGTRELTQTITVNYPTGVDDVTATVVTVYPNPTSGILKVSGTVANQMIRVTDVTGSLKGSYKTQEGITTIDLTGYAKGTYLVQYNGKAYKIIRK